MPPMVDRPTSASQVEDADCAHLDQTRGRGVLAFKLSSLVRGIEGSSFAGPDHLGNEDVTAVSYEANSRTLRLADGRRLAWLDLGRRDGYPVICLHGTPGSSHLFAGAEDAAVHAGIRLIAVDRPGYGLSTFHPGMCLTTSAEDVGQLAAELGLEHFAMLGASSGGAHAVACARFLGSRVQSATIVSGVAPLAEADATKGMPVLTKVLIALTRLSLAAPAFALGDALGRIWPDQVLRRLFPSPRDADILLSPTVRSALLASDLAPFGAVTRAASQDFMILTRDWGFRLEEVSTPVHIWHGSRDPNVPLRHARLLAARIPRAVLHRVEGEGHLIVVSHIGPILQAISESVRPATRN